MTAQKLVVVSVGTFHLAFDRLIDWIQDWYEANPQAHLVLQHGASRPIPGAENIDMCAPDELIRLYERADAIILQGGAGGVMDTRACKRIPIVVPRLAQFKEAVDDHQVGMTQRLEEMGLVHRATDRAGVHRLIDDALSGALVTRTQSFAPTEGPANLARFLDTPVALLPRAERRRRLRRWPRYLLRSPEAPGPR